jgi:hypothetical protein
LVTRRLGHFEPLPTANKRAVRNKTFPTQAKVTAIQSVVFAG